MSKLPQVMLNVTVAEPSVLADKASVRTAVEEKMRLLDGRGRVLVRPSGTEPVVRIMTEAPDKKGAADLVDTVRSILHY